MIHPSNHRKRQAGLAASKRTMLKIDALLSTLKAIKMPSRHHDADRPPTSTPSPTPSTNTPIPTLSQSQPRPTPSPALTTSRTPRLTQSQVMGGHHRQRQQKKSISRGNLPGSRFIPTYQPPQIAMLPPSKTLRRQRQHGIQNTTADWRGTNEDESIPSHSRNSHIVPTFYHLRVPHETNLPGSNFSKLHPTETKIISVPTNVDWSWFLATVAGIVGMKQHVIQNHPSNPPLHIKAHDTNQEINSMMQLRSNVSGTILDVAWYDSSTTLLNGIHGNASIRELPKFDPDTLPVFVQIVKANEIPSRHRYELTNTVNGGSRNTMGCRTGAAVTTLPRPKAHLLEIVPTWTWSEFVQSALYLLERKEEPPSPLQCNDDSTKDVQHLGNAVATTYVYNGTDRVRSMRELSTLEGGCTLSIHLKQGEIDNSTSSNSSNLSTASKQDLTEISRFIIGSDLAFELEMAASTGQHLESETHLLLKDTSVAEETALVPYVNQVLLSKSFEHQLITELLWKHLWVSFVVSPPGGEACALCKDIARKRGYVHLSFEAAVSSEITLKSGLGLEILQLLSSGSGHGQGGLPPDLATRVLRKAIYLAAVDRAEAMDAPSLEDSPLTRYMDQEKTQAATKQKQQQTTQKQQRQTEGPFNVYRKILQMKFIIDGFPLSMNHCQHFEQSTTVAQRMYYIALTEQDSLKCVLSNLETPLFTIEGTPTDENRGGHAGYRRKMAARKKIEFFFQTIAPVLHYFATTGNGTTTRLIRLVKSRIMKLKKGSQRRILAVDPELYNEMARTLSPQPMVESTTVVAPPVTQTSHLNPSPPPRTTATKRFIRKTKHEQRQRSYHHNVPIIHGGGNNGDLTMKSLDLKKRNDYINGNHRSSKRVDARTTQHRADLLEQVADGKIIEDDDEQQTNKQKHRIHSECIEKDKLRTGERVTLTTSNQVDLSLMAWLRTLNIPGIYDLTTTTEHWRRDFSNGYVIAQICHFYDSKRIQLRSFRNGNSTVQKRENWMRIIEYFRKNSRINITMDQVARVSKAYANAIRPILLILHQYFVLKRDGPKKHRNTPKQQNYPRTTIGALEKNSLKKYIRNESNGEQRQPQKNVQWAQQQWEQQQLQAQPQATAQHQSQGQFVSPGNTPNVIEEEAIYLNQSQQYQQYQQRQHQEQHQDFLQHQRHYQQPKEQQQQQQQQQHYQQPSPPPSPPQQQQMTLHLALNKVSDFVHSPRGRFDLQGFKGRAVTANTMHRQMNVLGCKLTKAEASALFVHYDRNQDGEVNYAEFLRSFFDNKTTGVQKQKQNNNANMLVVHQQIEKERQQKQKERLAYEESLRLQQQRQQAVFNQQQHQLLLESSIQERNGMNNNTPITQTPVLQAPRTRSNVGGEDSYSALYGQTPNLQTSLATPRATQEGTATQILNESFLTPLRFSDDDGNGIDGIDGIDARDQEAGSENSESYTERERQDMLTSLDLDSLEQETRDDESLDHTASLPLVDDTTITESMRASRASSFVSNRFSPLEQEQEQR